MKNRMRVFSALMCAWLACACASACGGNAASPAGRAAGAPGACRRGRAFILLRHAEKASSDDDPPLSDRGRTRAQTIASMFANVGATRLVASTYQRTQETLAPLATRLSIPIEVRPMMNPRPEAGRTGIDHIGALLAELRASPDGAIVVVASHSNLLPRLARELGGGAVLRGVAGDSLTDDDYGRVYVITASCREGREAAPFVLELSSDRSN